LQSLQLQLLHLQQLGQVQVTETKSQQQQHWTICAVLSAALHLSAPQDQKQVQES
jgi:hypothetical protein